MTGANLAPIALFVYNRPVHARQTVEALQKNELAGESDLFIFSDAPKKPEAAAAVGEVRKYIKSISGFKSVIIVERDRNFGLANSVIDGVTRLCDEYGRAIVLEDDLLTSPYFLRFMNEALDRYQNNVQVMQISGHMFPADIPAQTDAVFLPMTTSWGWATWQRAWQGFDPAAAGYETLKRDRTLRRRFNLDGSYNYFGMLEQQLRGEIDSWAIRWYLTVFLRGGLTLFPKKSLVENMGFDGSGTHCGADRPVGPLPCGFRVSAYPAVAIDEEAKRAVYAYLMRAAKQGGRISRMRRKLSEWFKREPR
jgi:GT2 family glycosyltransferase